MSLFALNTWGRAGSAARPPLTDRLALSLSLSADEVIFPHAHSLFFCDCEFCLKTHSYSAFAVFPLFFSFPLLFSSTLDSVQHACQTSTLAFLILNNCVCVRGGARTMIYSYNRIIVFNYIFVCLFFFHLWDQNRNWISIVWYFSFCI